jgi:glyceraldehyde 3-phosphate dehydrogenase
MSIRVGINGFGRIGRLAFRRAVSLPDVEVVGINDLIDVEYLSYMLRYDSTHGRFQGDVRVENGQLVVNGKAIRITAERDPNNLNWGAVGADYVLESTGFFLSDETARAHINAGAKRGVMSAPTTAPRAEALAERSLATNRAWSSVLISGCRRAGSWLMVCPVHGPAHGPVAAPAA